MSPLFGLDCFCPKLVRYLVTIHEGIWQVKLTSGNTFLRIEQDILFNKLSSQPLFTAWGAVAVPADYPTIPAGHHVKICLTIKSNKKNWNQQKLYLIWFLSSSCQVLLLAFD